MIPVRHDRFRLLDGDMNMLIYIMYFLLPHQIQVETGVRVTPLKESSIKPNSIPLHMMESEFFNEQFDQIEKEKNAKRNR